MPQRLVNTSRSDIKKKIVCVEKKGGGVKLVKKGGGGVVIQCIVSQCLTVRIYLFDTWYKYLSGLERAASLEILGNRCQVERYGKLISLNANVVHILRHREDW